MNHLTLQSRGRSPAWSPFWYEGCHVGQYSCLLWPSDRQNSTTLIASQSQKQSQCRYAQPHCHYSPHHSSPSLPLTLAGRTACACVFFMYKLFQWNEHFPIFTYCQIWLLSLW
ncbi:hypothetical protein LDENG_00242080 [Lucifuga dentata]|nr:hypothetical protein LDENG_00242080 [Lucifuga dentata]